MIRLYPEGFADSGSGLLVSSITEAGFCMAAEDKERPSNLDPLLDLSGPTPPNIVLWPHRLKRAASQQLSTYT